MEGQTARPRTRAEAAKRTGQVINRLKLVQGFTAGQVVKSSAGFFSEKDIAILAGMASLAVKIDCILQCERNCFCGQKY